MIASQNHEIHIQIGVEADLLKTNRIISVLLIDYSAKLTELDILMI